MAATRPHRLALLASLLGTLLAGCAHQPAGPGPEASPAPDLSAEPKASVDAEAGMEPTASAGPEAFPRRLELTECTGWHAYSADLPNSIAPGSAPPGWEPDDTARPVAKVLMAGYDCHRLAVGPFERGPVRLIVDAHDRAAVPGSCWTGNGMPVDVFVVSSVWVDDDEIAAYLRDAAGLPAMSAAISDLPQGAGPGQTHTWSWDEGRSSITLADDGTTGLQLRDAVFFWSLGEGVASLALAFDRQGPAFTSRAAYGTFQPPMLMGHAPGGLFVGTARWYGALTAQGDFRAYGDAGCGA